MFSKKLDDHSQGSAPVARLGSSAPTGSTFSIIGSDVTIKGDVTASVDLHVDGRIDGDIQCAALVQGEGSHIAGAITAETARLAGTVSGSITARELVVLRSARINGDVFYDALTIEQGAGVEGRFAHRAPVSHEDDGGEPRLTLAG